MTPSACLFVLLALGEQASIAEAFPSYMAFVPNAGTVPWPDAPGGYCEGLGHADCVGGQLPLNAFGVALKASDKRWTDALCREDSDGDGYTNGEELGDPCCIWVFATPPPSIAVSHPGFPTSKPPDSYKKRDASTCPPKRPRPICPDECGGHRMDPFIEEEKDEDRIVAKIQFDEVVPAVGDAYMCKRLDLDLPAGVAATDLEIVGFELNDPQRMSPLHHVFMVNCVSADQSYHREMGSSWPCPAMTGCLELVGGWAPGGWGSGGTTGELFTTPVETGLKLHDKAMVVQFHWFNPLKVDHLKEQSSFDFYLTKKKRKFQSAILWTGNIIFGLPMPAMVAELDVRTPCTLSWSNKSLPAITMWAARVHMHGYGLAAYTEMQDPQNPQKWTRIGDLQHFDGFKQSFKYLPIDENKVHGEAWKPKSFDVPNGANLTTGCKFTTVNAKHRNIEFGLRKQDEMCINYFMYYPVQEDISIFSCASLENFNKTVMIAGAAVSTTARVILTASDAPAVHLRFIAFVGAFFALCRM